MNILTKKLTGAVTVGALLISSMAPALAQDRGSGGPAGGGDRGRGGGLSAGEVIAGALVIGGIAAVAASAGKDRDYAYNRAGYRDRHGHGNRYGFSGGNPNQAIEHCVRTAEREASRASYGRANVTEVGNVDRTRYGYEVRGRIAVNASNRDWRDRDDRYGRSWNDGGYGYDSGSFRCKVEAGRIVDLDFSGIRNL